MAERRIEERLEAYNISRIKRYVFNPSLLTPNVFRSMVSELETLFGVIENQDIPKKQILRSFQQFFYELCDEQPGVVTVRHSFESFQALITLESREYETGSSDSDSDWDSEIDTHRVQRSESFISSNAGLALRSDHEDSSDSLSSSESESAEVNSQLEASRARTPREKSISPEPKEYVEPTAPEYKMILSWTSSDPRSSVLFSGSSKPVYRFLTVSLDMNQLLRYFLI